MTPTAALLHIHQATEKAWNKLDDEHQDRQAILEELVITTREIISKVRF
jgi:hypothetical protein